MGSDYRLSRNIKSIISGKRISRRDYISYLFFFLLFDALVDYRERERERDNETEMVGVQFGIDRGVPTDQRFVIVLDGLKGRTSDSPCTLSNEVPVCARLLVH